MYVCVRYDSLCCRRRYLHRHSPRSFVDYLLGSRSCVSLCNIPRQKECFRPSIPHRFRTHRHRFIVPLFPFRCLFVSCAIYAMTGAVPVPSSVAAAQSEGQTGGTKKRQEKEALETSHIRRTQSHEHLQTEIFIKIVYVCAILLNKKKITCVPNESLCARVQTHKCNFFSTSIWWWKNRFLC